MADDTTETDQIEQELAETRARMDRRLDELGTKLAPNQIVNDALAHVSGGDGADFARTLIAKAKANPVPAALAGVGLIWLMASSQNKPSRGTPDLQTRLRSAEAGVVRLEDEHPDVHASRLDDVRGQVLGVARSASDTAASYSQRIRDALATASESARRASRELGGAASSAVGRLDHSRGGLQALAGSPLVTGGAAALLGLIAGVLLPVSEQEERALGGLAGQLRGKGRELAQEVVDRGSRVAGEALGAAKESAHAHGLTADRPVGELLGELRSGGLIDHVKQAAHEVVDAGKVSVSSQLKPEGERDG